MKYHGHRSTKVFLCCHGDGSDVFKASRLLISCYVDNGALQPEAICCWLLPWLW